MTNLPGQRSLTVLFEDANLVVIEKPAGWLSQSDKTHEPSLVDYLRQYFGRHYVGLVHRLDRPTSGLMVVAKRSKAAQRLSESLKNGELKRKYMAWVAGNLVNDEMELVHWVSKDEATNMVTATLGERPGAKRAKTLVKVIEKKSPITLCEFELETGRSHQIRAQMAAYGAPLLGDVKYGGPALDPGVFLLHSSYLEFPHPIGKKIYRFTSAPPVSWTRYLRA